MAPTFYKNLTIQTGNDYLKSYNTLDYQIIPEARIPELSEDLTKKKFVCMSSEIDDINDVLILKGNKILANRKVVCFRSNLESEIEITIK